MKFAPGGWKYAIPPLLAAPFVLIFSVAGAIASIVAGVATLAFFRDPDRTPPPTGTVAPCDGNVSVLREEDGRVRLGIFMNVWHVHVIRAPFDGTVTRVEHVSGANRPAFSKESDRNERVHMEVETDETRSDDHNARSDDPSDETESTATVTFIAGAFARRIHPYVEVEDTLDRGQRIGHIAFGSRVDVLFPPTVDKSDIGVEIGDSTTAGETVIVETDVGSPFEFDVDDMAGSDRPTEMESRSTDRSDDAADAAS